MNLGAAKELVWQRWPEPAAAPIAAEVAFHGPAPIGSCRGRAALDEALHAPLARAFGALEWRPQLFLGGEFEGATWVASTGELRGRFTAPFCGVPPTRSTVGLRYGEFCRVVDGEIAEIRFLFDLLALAAAAGIRLLPIPPADETPPIGPTEIDGLRRGESDPAETAATLQLVEDMLGGCNRLVDGELRSMGMDAYWHDDMRWAGPHGIGTSIGFEQFQEWAQGPSVASFPNRRGGFHRARIADGRTAAFTGWPSLRGTFDGAPFRGIPPSGTEIGQNIMDFYVRRGDRLHENWVLIDLVDFAAQCGVDLLAGLPQDAAA